MTARKRSSETGSAAVLVCALAAVVAALALGVSRLAVASTAAARAQTAADAAALAAARELANGRSEPEAGRMAQAAARANGARLLGCDCRGPGATVRVAFTGSPDWPFSTPARATARAELQPECPG